MRTQRDKFSHPKFGKCSSIMCSVVYLLFGNVLFVIITSTPLGMDMVTAVSESQ